MLSTLADNLHAVETRIQRAVSASGRVSAEVALLPVTKSVGPQATASLARLLAADRPVALAENRVDVLETKLEAFADLELPPIAWHFIGHLQRNKARRVVQNADVIHSVDSLRLLEALARLCEEEGRRLGIYLQVDLTGEATKHGLQPDVLAPLVKLAGQLPQFDLLGLMAMAPLREQAGRDASTVFDAVAQLAQGLEARPELGKLFRAGKCQLSMGMSADFEQAITAGSHCVRVGSALYSGVMTTAATETETN